MSVRHVIRPKAKDDIIEQFRYYLLEDAFDAALRFLEAVDESIEQVCKMPKAGAPRQFKNPALVGLRSWPVRGFDEIRIYYVAEREVLRVIRVLHGRRNIRKILESETDEGPA